MVNINKEEVQHVVEDAEAATFHITMYIFFLRLGPKSLLALSLMFQKTAFKIDLHQFPQYSFRPAGTIVIAMILLINF